MSRYHKIVLFGTPILLFIILRSIGFDGLYGQDAYEYLKYTKALSSFMNHEVLPRDFFWPVYYPLLGAILNYIIPNTGVALQLLSVLSMGVSAVYTYKIISLTYTDKDNTFVYVLIFFLLSPVVFRMGLLVMSDMLATALIILCIYHAIYYVKNQHIKNLYFTFVFGVIAVMTRYASFVVLLPLALYILYWFIFKIKNLRHSIFFVIIFLILISPHILIKSQNLVSFIDHNALTNWSVLNFFKNSFLTDQGYNSYKSPNLIYAFSNLFHPRYLIAGSILLLIFLTKKIYKNTHPILSVCVVFYALFVAGIDTQNSRFLLLSFPIILIILFPVLLYICDKILSKQIKYISVFLLIMLQFFLSIKGMKPILERNTLEKQIVKQLEPYQHNTLYSFDIDIALQGRALNFTYKNLWIKEYSKFEEKALLLFHPTKFNKQWKGKNPIVNWSKIQKEYELKILKECYDGWKLYQIHLK